jgi:glycosyltransferase involved in cell wall biosynthesis
MKVFHVIVALHPSGGAELMLARLALYQRDRQQIEPVVVALGESGPLGDDLRAAGIEVRAMGLKGAQDVAGAVWRLSRLIARERPAIVQTWMYHADLIGALAARLAGNRNVIWGIRNTDIFAGAGVSGSLGIIMRLCARLSRGLPRAIVCVAESARASHIGFGYAADRMVVLPNGFVPPENVGAADRREVRRALGLAENALLIGSVGRFNAYKDHRTFVRAMGRVAELVPDARFVMVGRGIDAANQELRDWIEETRNAGRFILLGHRSDVARCFASLDLFCLHSGSEGFPNVLAEAMLAGVPSVATDVGDARLLAGGHAEIVPPGDAEALAQAVVRLCEMGAAERASLGGGGRAHVESRYGLTQIAEAYCELYRRVRNRESLASFGLNSRGTTV